MRLSSSLLWRSVVGLLAGIGLNTAYGAVPCNQITDTITTITPVALDDLFIPVATPFSPIGMCTKADFNGDGKLDLLIQGNSATDTHYLFLANSNGKLQAISQQWSNGYLGLNWSADLSNLYLADFNSDGRLDVMVEARAPDRTSGFVYFSNSGLLDDLGYTWDNIDRDAAKTTNLVAGVTAGSFDVSNAGSSSYSVPIVVPPGRAGMEPELSIDYTSQGGVGLLGVGWSLNGLSVISRCAAAMEPDGYVGGINFDSKDRFCLDGQRLVAVSGVYGLDGTQYRTEVDNFSRITSLGIQGAGPAYFKVETKAGLTMYFGYAPGATDPADITQGRIEAQGRQDVLLWALTKVVDRFGNDIRFFYHELNSEGVYYPTRIEYTGFSSNYPKPTRMVLFGYLPLSQNQVVVRFVGGSKVTTAVKMSSIKTYLYDESTASFKTLVRDYRFTYAESPITGKVRLTQLQECGATSCFKPTTLTWSDAGTGQGNLITTTTLTKGSGLRGTDLFGVHAYVDVDGNGFADFCRYQGTTAGASIFCALNIKNGGNESVKETTGVWIGSNWGASTGFVDVNLDGKADFCRLDATTLTCTTNLGVGGAQVTIVKTAVAIGADDAGMSGYFDVNGNTYPDYCAWNGSTGAPTILCSLDVGKGGASTVIQTPTTLGLRTIPGGASFTDANGDGKTDYCRLEGPDTSGKHYIFCTVNLSEGTTEKRIVTELVSTRGEDYPGTRAFVDVTGDGAADYCRVESVVGNKGQLVCTINLGRGGQQVALSREIGGTTSTTIGWAWPGTRSYADVNGDGRADFCRFEGDSPNYFVFCTTNLGTSGAERRLETTIFATYDYDGVYRYVDNDNNGSLETKISDETWGETRGYVDFNGDGKADFCRLTANGIKLDCKALDGKPAVQSDQVTNITNGFGVAVNVTYKPLTDSSVYTKGTAALVYPYAHFIGPMYVVSNFTTSNGVGGLNKVSFTYKESRIHLAGRGALGFRQVTEVNEAAKTATDTLYLQQTSSSTFWRTGLVETSTDYVDWPLNKFRSSVATNIWGTITTAVGSSFVFLNSSKQSGYNLGSTVTDNYIISESTTTSNSLDTTGNVTKLTLVTKDVKANRSYTKVSVNTYADDTLNWNLGRLSKVVVTHYIPQFDVNGVFLTTTRTQTRTSSFVYYPGTGALNKEIVEPGTPLELVSTYTYDGFGNKIRTDVSGSGIATRTAIAEYTADGYFSSASKNALGHTESRVYDARYGEVVSLIGPNAIATVWEFDEFGRKRRESRADGTSTTISMGLCSGQCLAGEVYFQTTQATGQAPTTSYLDLLGRVVRSETADFQNLTLRKRVAYDALGRTLGGSAPALIGHAEKWQCTLYDKYSRISAQTVPTLSNCDTVATAPTDVTYSYSGLDTVQTTTRTGQAGQTAQVIVETKDVLGKLSEMKDALGSRTRYRYDEGGNLVQLVFLDASGDTTKTTRTTLAYNIRDFKTSMDDADMHHWEYTYNVAGELISQKDALNNVITMEYDLLGRLTKRTEPDDGVTVWTYDTAPKGIGKLASVTNATTGYSRTQSYDNFGRPISQTSVIEGAAYAVNSTYDSVGRLDTLTYPDTGTGKPRLVTRNVYDSVGNGYLTRVENAVSGLKYWELLDMDAEGRVTQERLGNNVHTARVFDARGRLTELDATIGTNGAQRQLLSYVYDSLGNLEERRDLFPATAIRENFSYDALNRLTAVSQNGTPTASFAYDNNGNIKAKSDFGDDYRYGENGAGPHAMTSVRKAGALIASFAYDANGRLTSGNGRVVSYTSFGMPRTITRGSNTATFKYNTDHMRMVQTTGTGKITYLDPNEKTGGYLYEKETKSGKTIHRHFIAGGVAVLEYEAGSSVIERTRYFLKDHLGSTDTVLDELGNIVERLSFDAFGMRRDAGSWTVTGAAILPLTTNRGYTGHEHLDGVGLIHMNGRIYDPQAGRFLTADPLIQAPRNSQSLNRYSYVVNNPLTLTDPSGYSFMRKYGHVVVGTLFMLMPMGQGIGIAMMQGFMASFAMSRGDLKAAVVGAISAGMFNAVGATFGDGIKAGSAKHLQKILAHGVVGGMASRATGGKFSDGFRSAAAAQAFAPMIDGMGGEYGSDQWAQSGARAQRIAVAAIIGGSTAAMTGGKFANGAVTAAFSRAFSEAAPSRLQSKGTSGSSTGLEGSIDPAVAKEMAQAWRDSQVDDPKLRHEEGGYIVLNVDGTQGVVRWKTGGGASIVPPPRATDGTINGLAVIGEFHTHPNPPIDEVGLKWNQGGHSGDWNAIRAENYSGNSYIISRNHIYQVSPIGTETTLGSFKSILGN